MRLSKKNQPFYPLEAANMIEFLLLREIIPDWLIRWEIRRRLAKKLREENALKPEQRKKKFQAWIEQMKTGPIALNTREANEQHYELPTTFFKYVLGRNLKYSSGFWRYSESSLDESEEAMLAMTVERAQIQDGQKILELGCGWGSLTLWMARKFPNTQITAVSNSKTQRVHIEFTAKKLGLQNVRVITCDMNELQLEEKFDRAVSVEMFEHMRNYKALLEKIAGFLNPGGKLFVHVFAHKGLSYPYEAADPSDWIAKYFFTGGLMPSADIFDYFQDHFRVLEKWVVPGTHYRRTCRAWLELMDLGRINIKIIFRETYGVANVRKWWMYWRIFFMSCEELFGYKKGTEWLVSHTLLEKK